MKEHRTVAQRRSPPARGTAGSRTRGSARRSPAPARGSRARSGPRVHWGRLGLLVLVLVAAALYVGPLREYFVQQDRCMRETATLRTLKEQNRALSRQIKEAKTTEWVVRAARETLGLVPPNVQAFVVSGLPDGQEEPRTQGEPSGGSMSLGDRFEDLWNTLLR